MLKVAIIEDEAIIRQGLICTIDWQGMGCEICGEAANGVEGLEVIRNKKPDVIFTDIRMPKMDGLEMTAVLRRENAEAKIVFLTSYAEFKYAQEAIRLQAYDYLLKPVDENKLKELLFKIGEEKNPVANSVKQTLHDIGSFKQYEEQKFLSPYVRKVLERIRKEYKNKLTIDELANELGVSTSYISRKLKEDTGHTFGELLSGYRLRKAACLLAEGTFKVYEIAEQTGFGDYKNFCQVFKKYLNLSPTKLMQELKKEM